MLGLCFAKVLTSPREGIEKGAAIPIFTLGGVAMLSVCRVKRAILLSHQNTMYMYIPTPGCMLKHRGFLCLNQKKIIMRM